jgi:hypothetical protein
MTFANAAGAFRQSRHTLGEIRVLYRPGDVAMQVEINLPLGFTEGSWFPQPRLALGAAMSNGDRAFLTR